MVCQAGKDTDRIGNRKTGLAGRQPASSQPNGQTNRQTDNTWTDTHIDKHGLTGKQVDRQAGKGKRTWYASRR